MSKYIDVFLLNCVLFNVGWQYLCIHIFVLSKLCLMWLSNVERVATKDYSHC